MGQMFNPGPYRGVVLEITPSVSKVAQSPQVAIKVGIQWAWDGQAWVAVDEAERWIYLSMSGRAADYTMRKLDAIGFNGDFNNPKASDEAMKDGVDLECFHETYQGRVREKFEIPIGDFEPTPLEATGIRELNELWRQRKGATATVQPKAKPKPPAAPPSAPPIPPDDGSGVADPVPF